MEGRESYDERHDMTGMMEWTKPTCSDANDFIHIRGDISSINHILYINMKVVEDSGIIRMSLPAVRNAFIVVEPTVTLSNKTMNTHKLAGVQRWYPAMPR